MIKTKRYTFFTVSDVDLEESCFFNEELKIPDQQFLTLYQADFLELLKGRGAFWTVSGKLL